MAIEIRLAGHEFEFVVRVRSYEFATADGYDDANWLLGEAGLTAGRSGRFEARQPVTVRTVELLQFRDELRQLLEARTGKATLDHLEEQIGCTVDFADDGPHVTVFVKEHFGPELRFTADDVTEAGLTALLSDLDAALEQFPVRLAEP